MTLLTEKELEAKLKAMIVPAPCIQNCRVYGTNRLFKFYQICDRLERAGLWFRYYKKRKFYYIIVNFNQ